MTGPGRFISPAPLRDNAAITSYAGSTSLKIQYAKREWDTSFVFGANETGASTLAFGLNWMTDWAGLKASTNLGLIEPPPSPLGMQKASLLHTWFFPLDRQLEIRFTYNDKAAEIYTITWEDKGDETKIYLGPAGPAGNGPLRVAAKPYAVPFPLIIGTVLPLPLAADEAFGLSDKFLGRSRLFAGADIDNVTLRAGYWMAPEESTNVSWTIVNAAAGGLPFGTNLSDIIQVKDLNHWDEKGSLNNRLTIGGIPLPLTDKVKLSAVHIFNYGEKSQSMSNEFQLLTGFSIGPVGFDPWVSYFMNDRMNEIQSGLKAAYKLAPLPRMEGSGLDIKLIFRENGVRTIPAGPKPDTVITAEPAMDFWVTLIPKWLLFQINSKAPFLVNLADSEKDTAKIKCRAMLMLNLKPGGSIGFDDGYDGQGNALWLLYNTEYDFKKNEVTSGSLGLSFKIQW